jgi:hypothetical protein
MMRADGNSGSPLEQSERAAKEAERAAKEAALRRVADLEAKLAGPRSQRT